MTYPTTSPFDPTLSPVSKFLHDRYIRTIRGYLDEGFKPHEVAYNELMNGSRLIGKDDQAMGRAAAAGFVRDLLSLDDQEALIAGIDEAVREARNGNQDWLERCAFIVTNLNTRGVELPKSLAQLAHDAMLGVVERKPARGRPKPWKRDVMIQEAVIMLLHCFPELKATRNEASTNQSACSIVSEVLKYFDINLSEKSVEAIYHKAEPF